MVEFLKLIQLKKIIDVFNRVRHAFHDVVRPLAGRNIPGFNNLEKTGFIHTRDVAFQNKFSKLFFPFGKNIPVLNELYAHVSPIQWNDE